MVQKKWFQAIVTAILLALLILLLHQIQFFFDPVMTYIGAIALPLIGGGILFYLSRPLLKLLEHYKVPRILGIVIIFLLFIVLGYIITQFIAPVAQEQFTRLVDNIPDMAEMIGEGVTYWQQNQDIIPSQFNATIDNVANNLESYLQDASTVVINVVSQLISFVFALVLIPFFLFFMLKDGDKLIPFIRQFLGRKAGKSFAKLAHDIDHTLHSFILGQLTVSIVVGLLLLVGYLIIDLPYALTLSLFAMVMNVIPFVGPFLAVVPAILVGLFEDPILAVWVAVITIIAQQLEGNFVSPNVMGKALSIHPLTIITLILAAGSLAGFLGLLFAIPTYAVIKTIVRHFYQEWLERRTADHR
ncbi:AI-2E family transporter [Halobacillus litoralis]|uniref:AI-2E family transporter n=1 Tax=Halobacillus litoralis TaxID=45668 RepID=A0A845DT45_9BACI|nr:AI-2E family transporter [Halobacillus litoralis]MYL29423.1 AI-2E family transporter [Halobacillus halophilus]MYL36640.1 AI-2E family transporter [Halobacillus litoralis]